MNIYTYYTTIYLTCIDIYSYIAFAQTKWFAQQCDGEECLEQAIHESFDAQGFKV